MKEILFRGKRIDNGEWAYGYLIEQNNPEYHTYIIRNFLAEIDKENIDVTNLDIVEVDLKTVGQYTGLKDKNGNKIFEGDIVRNKNKYFQFVGIVKYQNGEFVVDWKLHQRESNGVISSTVTHHLGNAEEIIGNIYDNQELLRGEE